MFSFILKFFSWLFSFFRGGSSYTVQKGDSLSAIAQKHYGDANQWHKIFEANQRQIKDPNLIYPGQVLRLPK